jgi:hypothetical protein
LSAWIASCPPRSAEDVAGAIQMFYKAAIDALRTNRWAAAGASVCGGSAYLGINMCMRDIRRGFVAKSTSCGNARTRAATSAAVLPRNRYRDCVIELGAAGCASKNANDSSNSL